MPPALLYKDALKVLRRLPNMDPVTLLWDLAIEDPDAFLCTVARCYPHELEGLSTKKVPTSPEEEMTKEALNISKTQGKLQAIKYVRSITGWGLKEVKDWVDNLWQVNGIKTQYS